MLTAKEIMTRKVITVTPETEIARAVEVLLTNHINGVPVVNADGELMGILCQSDLVFQQKQLSLPPILTLLDGIIPLSSSKKFEKEFEKISAVTVAQAMVTDPVTVEPDTPLNRIAQLMVENHYHTLPVVEGSTVVGIIGKEDILKTLMS